jgi:hypothetical protein
MTSRVLLTAAFALGVLPAPAADPGKSVGKGAGDSELVERVIAARREYQQTLVSLYDVYAKAGDRERAKWVEDELKSFHLISKPSYRLDIQDVPPPNLEAKVNVKEANDLFKEAMEYKDRGFGTDYTLNQRRAEIRFQEILTKYPSSDKIAEVAYQLGDLYESKAFRQYGRAAAYFERSHQWKRGTQNDALMRAAKLHDKQTNDKTKAIELYRDVIAHDTDANRIKESERRLADLTGQRK